MEQILTKVLHSQVKPSPNGGQVLNIMLTQLISFLAVSAAWSQYSLAPLQQPPERSRSCGRAVCAAYACGRCSTTGSFFNYHLSTRPLLWPSSRPSSFHLHHRPPVLDQYFSVAARVWPPGGRHVDSQLTRVPFFWFSLLLLCTRTSLGGLSRERVRNHFSIYFSGSARQPFITSEKQH